MSELEEKLGSLLSNPQLMQQVAALAQTMGKSSPSPPQPQAQQPSSLPDPALLQGIAGMMQSRGVDSDQQALLHALTPYLSPGRIGKLERAMRAARLAGAASAFLKLGGSDLFGRR